MVWVDAGVGHGAISPPSAETVLDMAGYVFELRIARRVDGPGVEVGEGQAGEEGLRSAKAVET